MDNYIYSSFDKAPIGVKPSEIIRITPTLANRRLLIKLINQLIDTCEVDCSHSVQMFADKYIGEPAGLNESIEMLNLYDQMHKSLAQKLANDVLKGNLELDSQIISGYKLTYWLYQILQNLDGIGVIPFNEEMKLRTREVFETI